MRVRLYACRRLSGRLTGDIRMQRRASMATVRRRVSEGGAGGISRSQLNAIQQVLEGGVGVGVGVGGRGLEHNLLSSC